MRRNKYGNKWVEYNGRKYQSMMEASYAVDLDLQLKAGLIKSWEPQIPIPLYGAKPTEDGYQAIKFTTWVLDFKVTDNKGRIQWVDVKGQETDVFKLKYKLAKINYPNRDFRIVKKFKINDMFKSK